MTPVSDEKKNVARRLRIDEKKSFPEIAKILGCSAATVFRWARAEGWPDPQKEKEKLRKLLAEKNSFSSTTGGEEKPEKTVKQKTTNTKDSLALLAAPFAPIEGGVLSEPLEKMVEALFRFSAGIVAEGSRWDMKTAVKLMENSGRILVGIRTPVPSGDTPRFLVMEPGTRESYRDPPEEEADIVIKQ